MGSRPCRDRSPDHEESTTTMAKRCENCGKGPMSGHNVSHSKVRTNRRFMPNLHVATMLLKGRPVKARLCTRCIRTQSKVR
jgi:large subunit ribosomal protein L28